MAGLSFIARFKERTFLLPRSGELDTSLSKPVEFSRTSRSALRRSALLPPARLSHLKLTHNSAGRRSGRNRGLESSLALKAHSELNDDPLRNRSLRKSLRTLLAEQTSARGCSSHRGDSEVILKSAKAVRMRLETMRPTRVDIAKFRSSRKLSP